MTGRHDNGVYWHGVSQYRGKHEWGPGGPIHPFDAFNVELARQRDEEASEEAGRAIPNGALPLDIRRGVDEVLIVDDLSGPPPTPEQRERMRAWYEEVQRTRRLGDYGVSE